MKSSNAHKTTHDNHGLYAGEVSPQDAWDALSRSQGAMLVDVRTTPEWQFVGTPDLSSTPAKLVMISWKLYPNFAVNPQFVDELKAAGAKADTPLYFLCRSGGRSLDAAIAATEAGFTQAYNITDGFEGEPDSARHRGCSAGWKAAGLPWVQG